MIKNIKALYFNIKGKTSNALTTKNLSQLLFAVAALSSHPKIASRHLQSATHLEWHPQGYHTAEKRNVSALDIALVQPID